MKESQYRWYYFNPRTPVGCDRLTRLSFRISSLFQSTHPSGVRPKRLAYIQRMSLFQSTHPSGVRLVERVHVNFPLTISIHAPQWGATITQSEADARYVISIHAPQWGATMTTTLLARTHLNFNPRTPVGCDLISRAPSCRAVRFQSTHPSGVRRRRAFWHNYHWDISIHAPQWGATGHTFQRLRRRDISIHAPQWGAT